MARETKPLVLVVEDDIAAGDAVVHLLLKHGYEVQWLMDGQGALARLRELVAASTPVVLLLDEAVPGMSGSKVVEAVANDQVLLAAASPLLCLLPSWPINRVLELAPVNWQKTLQDGEAQQKLAANIFRQASLGTLK